MVLIMRLDNTRGYREVTVDPILERNTVQMLFTMLLAV
jgi:hypothetical protein